MDRVELTEYLVGRLRRGVSRDTIIREICERADLSWSQAEAYLEGLETSASGKIVGANLPLIIGLGIMIMIGGFLTAAISFYDFFSPFIDGTFGGLTGDAFIFYLLENWSHLFGAGVGIAMMGGSGYGLGKALSSARE